jgi:sugar phosphate isomerase/epimerase
LGYEGIGYTGTADIPQMLAALDKHGLKMFSIYVGAVVGPDGPSCDPGLGDAVRALKGRDTILWLTIRGRAADAEQQAVRVAREVADLAGQSGLRVALYPHYGFYVDRVEVAVRIAEKADRDNLGASFNLCHFLRVGDAPNLEQRLRQAMPRLMLVSINGTDHEGNWDRLIQTLDRGDYDVYAVLNKLRRLGYDGPVGLQCYQVPGDRRENLKRSMDAWRGFVKRMQDE